MKAAERSALVRAAAELESLSEVNEHLTPVLARVTGASLVFAYRGLARERGVRAYLPPRTPDLIARYFSEYAGECPLRKVKDESRGGVVATTLLYGHDRLLRTRVYDELWRPWGFDHHLALRFDDPRGGPELASLGLMINRDHRRGEFTADELRFFRGVAPILRAALRRAARLEQLMGQVTALEALLHRRPAAGDEVVLDADGRLLHVRAGPSAEPAVARLSDPRHPVRLAARRLLREPNGDDAPLELEHALEDDSGHRWRASLHRTRGRDGRPLVIVTLTTLGPPLAWASWGLTRTEQAVLEVLVAGRSNVEIGQQLFISPETVRTHLTRIYRKLGVRSRLEAVLAARVRGSS